MKSDSKNCLILFRKALPADSSSPLCPRTCVSPHTRVPAHHTLHTREACTPHTCTHVSPHTTDLHTCEAFSFKHYVSRLKRC